MSNYDARNRAFSVVIVLFAMGLAGCNVSVTEQSGTVFDDYVEEPLSDRAKKYTDALYTSNKMLDLIERGAFKTLYERHTNDQFKSITSYVELTGFLKGIQRNLGRLTSYKSQQWSFATSKVGETDVIMSRKIVEHGDAKVNYLFVFEKGGTYQQVLSLNVSDYTPPAAE